ncbi:MAG: sugar transferase [Bacteriovoracaceae bacterium]|nr:sugar transferase [Bacteriovoracaceae bacterium]
MKSFTVQNYNSPFQDFYQEKLSSREKDSKWVDPGFKWYFQTQAGSDVEFHLIDRFCAFALLILFSPILAAVSIGIKVFMPGPILFKQTRVGRNGKLFDVLKFRSMIDKAEESTGHTLSWEGDPRITVFGKFLRKSHLDEFPQLLNVLKGDMVFIGPRPERPEFTLVFEKEIEDYEKRHLVEPGITGLAQIACGYDAPAQEKLTYDLMYIAHRRSVLLNLLIAYHTAKKMLLMRSTANIVLDH